MKRCVTIIWLLCLVVLCASCMGGDDRQQSDPDSAQGMDAAAVPLAAATAGEQAKIAIITTDGSMRTGEKNSVQPLIDQYGEERILHLTWPEHFMEEPGKVQGFIEELGKNLEIKAIIANPAVPTSIDAFVKLREMRKDLFVVLCNPGVSYDNHGLSTLAQAGDLVLGMDYVGVGAAMVEQAHNLGAQTFVHYNYATSQMPTLHLERRQQIEQKCSEMGLTFIMKEVPYICGEVETGRYTTWGTPALITAPLCFASVSQKLAGPEQGWGATASTNALAHSELTEYAFVRQDIPALVAQYGLDTAFYSSERSLQYVVAQSVVEAGAIYQPDYSTPYDELARALLGVYIWEDGFEVNPSTYEENYNPGQTVQDIIARQQAYLAEKDMLGRVSIWPVVDYYMYSDVCTEYALKRLAGEVAQEGLEVDVLQQMMTEYAGVAVYLTPATSTETGKDSPNYFLMRMDYLVY